MIDIGKAMAVLLPDSLWVCMDDTYETLEMLDGTNKPTLEELESVSALVIQAQYMAHFKALYMQVVNDKLKELDYDSLATVTLWSTDANYGAEATKILNWYKSVIAYNYGLLALGTIPTNEEYLSNMPKYI